MFMWTFFFKILIKSYLSLYRARQKYCSFWPARVRINLCLFYEINILYYDKIYNRCIQMKTIPGNSTARRYGRNPRRLHMCSFFRDWRIVCIFIFVFLCQYYICFYSFNFSAFVDTANVVDYETNREKHFEKKRPSKSFLAAIEAIDKIVNEVEVRTKINN